MRPLSLLLLIPVILLLCVPLGGCSNTNYKAIGWVDGQAGVQGLAGPVGAEEPITNPYVINGKATVVGQYPEKPHLNVTLEPDATISVQQPAGYGVAPCPPYGYGAGTPQIPRGTGQILEGGKVVIQRR